MLITDEALDEAKLGLSSLLLAADGGAFSSLITGGRLEANGFRIGMVFVVGCLVMLS